MSKIIENVTRDDERAFYASEHIKFKNITISGPADGESAFKESKFIEIRDSNLLLRYPCWHCSDTKLINTKMTIDCRAPFWYCNFLSFEKVMCDGVKAIRESKNIFINDSTFVSPEICWKCSEISCKNSIIDSVYAFFGSKKIHISNIKFSGKYSFQYVKNMDITNSNFDTKDAFWHSKNVVVRDSVIRGEYLGWYSKNLTLINCTISGTQPLCYCKGLKLINCKIEGCDLAFEYSGVHASISGDIVSIKNPLKGKIVLCGKTNFIKDENDRSHGRFKLIIK